MRRWGLKWQQKEDDEMLSFKVKFSEGSDSQNQEILSNNEKSFQTSNVTDIRQQLPLIQIRLL